MSKTVKTIKALSDLQPDALNANTGTERGLGMLEHSLRRYGAGRSILADRNAKVIAGNKTLDRAIELGLEIQVVKTRGNVLVVVQREDLDLDDPENADARELAIADNRVTEVDLTWSPDALKALQAKDTDLTAFFMEDELADIMGDPTTHEHVVFDTERKVCRCCKKKCRKGCGCFQDD